MDEVNKKEQKKFSRRSYDTTSLKIYKYLVHYAIKINKKIVKVWKSRNQKGNDMQKERERNRKNTQLDDFLYAFLFIYTCLCKCLIGNIKKLESSVFHTILFSRREGKVKNEHHHFHVHTQNNLNMSNILFL